MSRRPHDLEGSLFQQPQSKWARISPPASPPPLRHITLNPDGRTDKQQKKRDLNNLAVKRFRMNKAEKEREREELLASLTKQNGSLHYENQVLKEQVKELHNVKEENILLKGENRALKGALERLQLLLFNGSTYAVDVVLDYNNNLSPYSSASDSSSPASFFKREAESAAEEFSDAEDQNMRNSSGM